jgi:hypothetical protein
METLLLFAALVVGQADAPIATITFENGSPPVIETTATTLVTVDETRRPLGVGETVGAPFRAAGRDDWAYCHVHDHWVRFERLKNDDGDLLLRKVSETPRKRAGTVVSTYSAPSEVRTWCPLHQQWNRWQGTAGGGWQKVGIANAQTGFRWSAVPTVADVTPQYRYSAPAYSAPRAYYGNPTYQATWRQTPRTCANGYCR